MTTDSNRIERILAVMVAAMGGDYEQRVPLRDVEDELLEVEVGINYLLEELGIRRDQNQTQTRSLRDQSAQIAAQAEALVAALSTPIITLWPGVLILPLIGGFDRERAASTTETLLDRVACERARYVILDLTGIDSITADTASALVSMIRAAQLLGVVCLITGIHPQTALQFIDLDADLGRMRTFARVSDALAVVLRDERVAR